MVEIGQIAIVAAFMLAVYVTVVGFAGGVLNCLLYTSDAADE